MSYFTHHAIIVTGDSSVIHHAHKKACEIFPDVTPVVQSQNNGFSSFLVPPDGSKEGWPTSDKGDDRRREFIEWLSVEDDFDWAEVAFGGDTERAYVPNYSDR